MIGWLRGQVAEPWRAGHRCGLLLICGGIGYEVQLTLRQWARLPATGGDLTLHIHHSVREDGWTLFGFGDRQERDLFRDLVAVSGVGPQMALALLGAMEVDELVRAIAAADLRRLSQAPGVGKRTAERLCLELRQKLPQRFSPLVSELAPDGLGRSPGDPPLEESARLEGSAKAEEIHSTLLAMGYDQREIHAALRAVASQGLDSAADAERWLGDCLRWLSRSVA
jgi:Holliday junction DNA helicase RuvA